MAFKLFLAQGCQCREEQWPHSPRHLGATLKKERRLTGVVIVGCQQLHTVNLHNIVNTLNTLRLCVQIFFSRVTEVAMAYGTHNAEYGFCHICEHFGHTFRGGGKA